MVDLVEEEPRDLFDAFRNSTRICSLLNVSVGDEAMLFIPFINKHRSPKAPEQPSKVGKSIRRSNLVKSTPSGYR